MFYVVDIYSFEICSKFDTEDEAREYVNKYSINPLESGCIIMDEESYNEIKKSRSKWIRAIKRLSYSEIRRKI